MCPERLAVAREMHLKEVRAVRDLLARSGRAPEELRHRRERSVLNLVVCQARSVVCLDRLLCRTCFAKACGERSRTDGETRSFYAIRSSAVR